MARSTRDALRNEPLPPGRYRARLMINALSRGAKRPLAFVGGRAKVSSPSLLDELSLASSGHAGE